MVSNDECPPQHIYLSHPNYQCAYHPYIQNLVKKRWEPGEDEGPESARERPMSQEDKVGCWLVLGGGWGLIEWMDTWWSRERWATLPFSFPSPTTT